MARLHLQLRPFEPSEGDPFDSTKAAHLLNRAGFGGTTQEIDKIIEQGPLEAVERLLDFPDEGIEKQDPDGGPDLSSIEDYPRNFREVLRLLKDKSPLERKELRQKLMKANIQALMQTGLWWLDRMVDGPHPLHEKLTFFWHGHFTTSARDERSAWLMWRQNDLLRANAAGNIYQFVRRISRDPAMLDYLNNNQNRKKHPNENYARELMELFTLGIGNYTERDVTEGARAFTGWSHDGEEFVFRKNDHDTGQKTFLGKSGNFDGDDVIDIIFSQKACAPFIAGKLFRFFAYDDPDPYLVESLAEVLRENKFEMRPVIKTILTSKAFYSPQAIGAQIKSPVQLLTGTVRLLDVPMPNMPLVFGALSEMGQVPLMPPNVKGWPSGRAWINTSTLLMRYNAGVYLAGGAVPMVRGGLRGGGRAGPTRGGEFRPLAQSSSEELVDHWLKRLIPRPVESSKRQVLLKLLQSEGVNVSSVRRMVQLIVSMPDYQLC